MGTEAFWIPAAIAAVSAIGSGANQYYANKRGQNAEAVALDNANNFKTKANADVNQLTQKIANNNPNAAANAEEGNFVSTLRKNVGGTTGSASTSPTNFGAPTSALGPTPGANKRFNSDTAAANSQVQSYGNTNAGEMSAVDTAINQRKNEGLQMGTLSANLNQLNQQAYGQTFVDQLRAKTAAQPNPWVDMFTKGLGAASGGMSKNGWFASNPAIGSANSAANYAGAFTGD
jgi:hypothetical protein